MGLLADAIERQAPPGDSGEPPAVVRCWRLWLEAEQRKRGGAFEPAHAALKASSAIAEALGWTHGTAPIWYVEAEALRGALLQDEGDDGAAAELLEVALQGWLYVGAVLGAHDVSNAGFARAVLSGTREMVSALAGEAAVTRLGMPPLAAAAMTFAEDRFVPRFTEVAGRSVTLTARVRSFADARRLVNDVLAASERWELPAWNPVRFEIALRMSLGSAAISERRFPAALGQADDALALTRRLEPGRERDATEAALLSNRAGALLALGRAAEAAREYEEATRRFGAASEGRRTRFGALVAQRQAGEPVTLEAVRALLAETDDDDMANLEQLRRWYLVLLAEQGAGELEEIVALIELLRDDRPPLRSGTTNPDPVVAHLCRPFTVLGARLSALTDTTLLVLEPSMATTVDQPHAPLVLTISAGGWHLCKGPDSLFDALRDLSAAAARERDRLNTRELPLKSTASEELRQAAARAWECLPAEAREAVLAARTVICMPAAAAGLDRLPFELLLHEGGWLGSTHVVARCPSFQYLEELAAPNARSRVPPARATVAQIGAIDHLGVLDEAEADAATAMRAAALLGLEPELRRVSSVEDARTLFAGAALVHYVGHGFASELGEWLPVSEDAAVTPSEVVWPQDEDAPAVFFNACLVGRVRHVAGGRQKGWAITLLSRGSPAVIGALAGVPDTACPLIARELYRAAFTAPLGEALRRARERLDAEGYHPLLAGAYVLHGDPNATLSRTGPARVPARWPALLTRFLATGSTGYRDQLVAALDDTVRAHILAWIDGEAVRWPALVEALLQTDPEGAGALRIVLCSERANDSEEVRTGYLAAAALEDSYAMAHLLLRHEALWSALDPDGFAATTEARLRMLGADRALVESPQR